MAADGRWQKKMTNDKNGKWQRSTSEAVTLPSAILPSAIRHPPSAICHLPSAICHLPIVGPVDRPICWRFTGLWTPGFLLREES